MGNGWAVQRESDRLNAVNGRGGVPVVASAFPRIGARILSVSQMPAAAEQVHRAFEKLSVVCEQEDVKRNDLC